MPRLNADDTTTYLAVVRMAMLELFDDAEIPIPCKSCDHEFAKLVGNLKREPEFTCPNCGQRFDAKELVRDLIDAEVREEVESEMRQAITDRLQESRS